MHFNFSLAGISYHIYVSLWHFSSSAMKPQIRLNTPCKKMRYLSTMFCILLSRFEDVNLWSTYFQILKILEGTCHLCGRCKPPTSVYLLLPLPVTAYIFNILKKFQSTLSWLLFFCFLCSCMCVTKLIQICSRNGKSSDNENIEKQQIFDLFKVFYNIKKLVNMAYFWTYREAKGVL